MSLKTKIRGFTAWVNLRLKPYEHLMNNVVMDLLTGTNMKVLLLSMTGREIQKIDDFDNLSQQQKMTRVEWVLDELKKAQVVPRDTFVDSRMFAMRSANHMFELLWRLVCHDIWFIWERLEYLQHASDEVLTEVPFKWIPEPPPVRKKKLKKSASLLSGFGASAVKVEVVKDEQADYDMSKHDPYPRHDYMKKFKEKDVDGNFPPPDECIMEMINTMLQHLNEGRKLNCMSVDDLVDSRVLCAIVNAFVPNTFTTEVLLNDRWAINKILRTIDKMFYIDTPFDSEDLCEADNESVCAYFCVFFMLAFKYRQSHAVVKHYERLRRARRETEGDLETAPGDAQLIQDLRHIDAALERLEKRFDMDFCFKWVDHVNDCSREVHEDVRKKIVERFDVINVPRNISINDMCLSSVINLSLTNGTGFYKATDKEPLSETRRLVMRDKNTGKFIDNFTAKDKEAIRKLLRLPLLQAVEVEPDKYPRFEFFFEAMSRNKQMKPGSQFLYQVFPNTMSTWQKVFIKAIRDNEIECVRRMVAFFRNNNAFINCREQQTGNSPLHIACKCGHYDVVLHLLENGADIDLKNAYRQTPLFSALEGLHREVAHLLVEWGCDIHHRGPRNQTAFETVKNDDFRDFLIDAYKHYSSVVPQIIDGDTELLASLVQQHADGSRPLNNLRSRCINGSTLLHTAAYFGAHAVMRDLVKLGVDINLLDYKGSSALHRTRDTHTMRLLLDAGIKVSVSDLEGNTPLHVKCYGETGRPSETAAVAMLLERGAKLTTRNSRGLLPVHCAAMQGRVDVVELLLAADADGLVKKALGEETGRAPPSLVHLAIANDYLNAATWLLERGFDTKEGELDLLMQRVLSEQLTLDHRADAVKFILDHGANPNPDYPGGNSGAHYAAAAAGMTDVLELLLAYGAEIDATNADGATPLFFACQCNNQSAASVLIDAGANVRIKNMQGLTAFDLIMDYEDWIECGYFSEEIRARLKAYNLKHSRDLIRAISKRVKQPHQLLLTAAASTVHPPPPAKPTTLPPIRRQTGMLTF